MKGLAKRLVTFSGIAGVGVSSLLLCRCLNPRAHAAPSQDARALGGGAASSSPFRLPDTYRSAFGDYRRKWTALSGKEYSGLHWGQYIMLYVNEHPEIYVRNYLEYIQRYGDRDANDLEDGETHFEPYPVGVVFLKENYLNASGQPGRPSTITAMIKREKGYDADAGDWQFIQFDADGKLLLDGNSRDGVVRAACAKCHGNIRERDFIFSTFCSLVPRR